MSRPREGRRRRTRDFIKRNDEVEAEGGWGEECRMWKLLSGERGSVLSRGCRLATLLGLDV